MCRPCRRSQSTRYAPHVPTLRPCATCSEMFETKQRTHTYCRVECRPHRSGARRPRSKPTHLRGYGYQHQKLRAEWAERVSTGEVDCALCADPIDPAEKWDLDHNDDRTGYRGPAHSTCNRRDGATRGNRQRGRVAVSA